MNLSQHSPVQYYCFHTAVSLTSLKIVNSCGAVCVIFFSFIVHCILISIIDKCNVHHLSLRSASAETESNDS